jgi:hypothetical protein
VLRVEAEQDEFALVEADDGGFVGEVVVSAAKLRQRGVEG